MRSQHSNTLLLCLVAYVLATAIGLLCALFAGCAPQPSAGDKANLSTAEGIAKIEADSAAAGWNLDQALHEGAKMWRAFVASAQRQVITINATAAELRVSNAVQATALQGKDATIHDLEQQLIRKTHDQVQEMADFKRHYAVLGVQTTIWFHRFLVACGVAVAGGIVLLVVSNMTNAGWIGTAAKGVVAFIWRRTPWGK